LRQRAASRGVPGELRRVGDGLEVDLGAPRAQALQAERPAVLLSRDFLEPFPHFALRLRLVADALRSRGRHREAAVVPVAPPGRALPKFKI
jgi:hypothetical protein